MFKVLFKSKILFLICLVSLAISSSLFFFIPYVTEKNIINLVSQNSKNNVEQMKITRSYYTDNIVKKIIKDDSHKFEFRAKHKGNETYLPLPATLIHDLSSLYSQSNGVAFRTYSNFPFKNRLDRKLTPSQKKTLDNIEMSDGLLVQKVFIDEKPMLRVTIADYMSSTACVECHNNHPDRTWERGKWKVGDIRGVIEVTSPLEEALSEGEKMRNTILFFTSFVFVVLLAYYSYMLLKREDELLKMNDILDKKVQVEIQKNQEKEQILIQKAKLSSQGEMLNNIAHQWRQPLHELSSVFMNIELQHSIDKLTKEAMSIKVRKAENILTFMSNTVEDFRGFFQVDKKKTSINISSLVDEVLNISSITLVKSNIEILKEIDKTQEIYGYKNELAQVLLNLIENAKDALLENTISHPVIKIECIKINEHICINIEDNAKGVSTDLINKVFDLYFTTKDKGSGIGLYISKLIIEKHFKGELKVLNIENGVRFSVLIP